MAHSQTNNVLVYVRMYAVSERGVVGRQVDCSIRCSRHCKVPTAQIGHCRYVHIVLRCRLTPSCVCVVLILTWRNYYVTAAATNNIILNVFKSDSNWHRSWVVRIVFSWPLILRETMQAICLMIGIALLYSNWTWQRRQLINTVSAASL